jgi:hypothetical protein
MTTKVQEVLADISDEELRKALKSREAGRIEKLREAKKNMMELFKEAQSAHLASVKRIDKELSELTGKPVGVKRAGKKIQEKSSGGGRTGGLSKGILECLKSAKKPLGAGDIIRMLPKKGIKTDYSGKNSQITITLGRLVKGGFAEKKGRGLYEAVKGAPKPATKKTNKGKKGKKKAE